MACRIMSFRMCCIKIIRFYINCIFILSFVPNKLRRIYDYIKMYPPPPVQLDLAPKVHKIMSTDRCIYGRAP